MPLLEIDAIGAKKLAKQSGNRNNL